MWRLGLLILAFSQVWSGNKNLKKDDITKTMEELLTYHVEYRELTPQIVKRAFKIYIESFDPAHIYLLHNEVKPFLEFRSDELQAIIQSFNRKDFSPFERLNQVIVQAIKRARSIRQEVKKNIKVAAAGVYPSYAKDIPQLRSRIFQQFGAFFSTEGGASLELGDKLFTLWEKRLARHEDTYIATAQKGEHYLALHMLKALAKSLDAHTCYYSPEEALELRTALEKQFAGIGVILREGIEGIAIVGMVEGGPAKKCEKIKEGDLIHAINGKLVEEMSYEEVLDRLKGARGESVLLGLKRKGVDRLVEVSIKREKIVMEDDKVRCSAIPFGEGIIGVIDLPSFYEASDGSSCEHDLKQAMKTLSRKGPLIGLVIDMRENSGGFLNQAVKVGGLFIANGVIVISKYAEGEIQYLRSVDTKSTYAGPLVILTSKASASAAEIVAQALQDYGSAIIVGDERTYGKGSIQYQTVTEEHAKAFFKVTVGRYYTVSGKSTQIDGVKADIHVPSDYSTFRVGEKYLDYPLPRDQVPSAYIDPLSDLDGRKKQWYQKNYLPNVERKNTYWRNMIPILSKSSVYRLEHDKNFTIYLKFLDEAQTFPPKTGKWGVDDLQLAEAVRIIQDMAILQNQ